MTWFIFALLSAFFDATYFAAVKKYLVNINKYVLASGVYFGAFIVLFSISIFKGIPEINNTLYSSIIASIFFNTLATILIYKALQITDLSLAAPMRSFTPVFLILTSFILLKELPTRWGIAGILLIVLGSYVINLSKGNKKILDPFKNLLKHKGILYMLLAALMASFAANFDKKVVQSSDVFFGTSLVLLLLGIIFITISKLKKFEIKKQYKQSLGLFFIIGTIMALVIITMNIAFTMQIVPYVISIKRLSILFSVIYGGLLFKEKNILKKSLGVAVMLLGTLLIIFL